MSFKKDKMVTLYTKNKIILLFFTIKKTVNFKASVIQRVFKESKPCG